MFQIQTNPLGCFAIRGEKIISHRLFISEQASEIAKNLIRCRKNLLPEEIELIKELSKSRQNIEIGIKKCERLSPLEEKFKINFTEISPSKVIPIEEIAEQIMISQEDLKELIRNVNIDITKEEMRIPEIDKAAIQLISTVDELNSIINLMNEQLREYYGMYFPEIDAISDNEIYASVASLGNRENLENLDLTNINLSKKIKGKIIKESRESFGMLLEDKHICGASALAREILNLYKLKSELEGNLKNVMKEIAPNLTYLAGYILGARLLMHAGSLEKLAFMPASTIQMLGAEKALFKFLRTKKLPPKHGIIFTLSEISTAQKKDRGKISRNFAAKVSIASRVDYFKGEFIGKELKLKFDKFIENLKRKDHNKYHNKHHNKNR